MSENKHAITRPEIIALQDLRRISIKRMLPICDAVEIANLNDILPLINSLLTKLENTYIAVK